MSALSYLFLGASGFGEAILKTLMQAGYAPKAIFSIPEYFNISYSAQKVRNYCFCDFSSLAKMWEIPFYWVESPHRPLKFYAEIIKSYEVDFLLVAGWYYKVPASVYSLSKMGAFGFHNSLLPQYAGGAPLVWAIIEGEREAGVSLFKMDENMDTGDLIAQRRFEIALTDSIAEVLQKATQEATMMSLELFTKPITFTPQTQPPIYYPQRTPEDGKIDLNLPAHKMYDFIRAQSYPYPGAFIQTIDGKKLVIDKAHIECAGGGAELRAKLIKLGLLLWIETYSAFYKTLHKAFKGVL